MKITSLMIASALAALPVAASAKPDAAEPHVAVVVSIATPAGLTDDKIRAEMARQAPRYQQIPGLIRKYFTIAPGKFGGIYYWTSKAAAQAWFSDTWIARVKTTYGTAADVTYFEVPVAIDGAKP